MRKVYVIHKPNDPMIQGVYIDRDLLKIDIEHAEALNGYYVKWNENANGSMNAHRFNGEIVYTVETVPVNKLLSQLGVGLP